uniref:K Homology domain-containing protein n=1 Tax=Quercus lobata TaxID=97700 RepID=A0A7N2KWC1_QUELO
MLERSGFCAKWRQLIFFCLSTTRFSILINGSPCGFFGSSRGLRQGDPLSPLFVLVMEALGRMLIKQFMKDTCQDLVWVTWREDLVLGLKINLGKSKLVSVGVVHNIDLLLNVLGCKQDTLPMKYLGLPLGAKFKDKTIWNPILEKMERRLAGWKCLVKLWQDCWCGETSLAVSYLDLFRFCRNKEASVAELMKSYNGVLFWDVSFFRGVHAWELEAMLGFMETIYGSSIRGFGEDKMCWLPSKDKGFMVNAYYRILVGPIIYGFPWKSIWKQKIPSRVAFFVWTAALGKCLMIDNLRKRKISGKRDVAKKALYDVSTLLHQNPRKDKPPLTFPMPFGGQGFHPPGAPLPNMLPPGNPMWSHWNSDSHGVPPMPWMGGYGNRPSEFVPGGFNGVPPGPVAEASAEFFMKILCSAGKIGGVIGKGGFNVRQLQQETGAGIYVQEASTNSDERVIRVSAFEAIWNQRSQTIEAILQLQNKVSEYSEKGNIITRLLVPSSKVGCILGQGGHVINEMRKRTQADIRVFSKDDKPKCAAEDEELVQVSGNFGVAKDALAEIASRLRVRTLRDANAAAESAPVGPSQGLRPAGSIPGGGLPQSGTMGAGSSGRYDPLKVEGYEYEPQSYPVPRAATGYPNVNSASDVKIPSSAVSSVIGSGGSNISNVGEVVGARVKLQNSHAGGFGCAVDIRGSSEHLNAAQSILQAFMASGGQNVNSQNYQNMNAQQGSYQNMNAQQSYQGSYQNMNAQQSPYQSSGQQGSYPNINVPQGAYHNISAQQSYQY